jgi:type IV pilus assembly protein PilA
MKMKLNNKGFTLVELIVVIAILGVLAAVLVPNLVPMVEKSRVTVDNSYIGEVVHNAELQAQSVTDANIGNYNITFTASTGVYTVAADTSTAATAAIATSLNTALHEAVPDTAFKSKAYKTAVPGPFVLKDGKVITALPTN